MRAKKKFIFSIVSVAIVAVFAVVFALAYSTANVKSGFNISFVAKDVDVTFYYQNATKATYTNSAYQVATENNTSSWHVTGREQTANREVGFVEELDGESEELVNNGNAYVQVLAIKNNGESAHGVDYTFTWKYTNSGYTVRVEVLDKVTIANDAYVVENEGTDQEPVVKTVYTSTSAGGALTATTNAGDDSATFAMAGTQTASLMKDDCVVLRVTVYPNNAAEAEYNDATLNLYFELKVVQRDTAPNQNAGSQNDPQEP